MGEFLIFLRSWGFTALGGALTFITGIFFKKIYSMLKKYTVEQIETNEKQSEGILSLLHYRIYENAQIYISRGSITFGELEDLEYLYKSYRKLGGNGTGEQLYEKCKNLEIRQRSD